jgi:orotidine-5'-phosphate decarboxylase
MPDGKSRVAVALDFDRREDLLAAARLLQGEVGTFKLGLEAFTSHGPGLVRELVARGAPVFLDLKLHDIPNTVGGAAAAAARTGASIVNVHASGGYEMMRVAGERARGAAVAEGLPAPRVIAVTVLTSLDGAGLAAVGLGGTPREAALRLAVLAREAGLDGVVCSPEEIEAIRGACGPDFFLIVPGVRPAGTDAADQKRIATPGASARSGADLLVIGRPILRAPDPVAAARAIAAEIDAALSKR